MQGRPGAWGIVRKYALPPLASALAVGAIFWPSAAWWWKSVLLLLSGLLVLLAEVPAPSARGAVLRGRSAALAVTAAVVAVGGVLAPAVLLGGPTGTLIPAAIVVLSIHLVGHLGESGLVGRGAAAEAAIALVAVLVAVAAQEARRLPTVRRHEEIAVAPEPPVETPDGGGSEPYSPPDPNLPAAFGGDGGGSRATAGSCPEELTEENTALLWMRLWDRRDEGGALRDTEQDRPAAVVPRRLHCACAPHRDRPELMLAYCGRTRELCQAEAGTRAGAGGCSVVAVSVVRRVDCQLEARGLSLRADETSLGVSVRSIKAASKLVPQWATLDARELSHGRLLPIRVQRLRWSRGSTAPAEWRATNFPGARRAAQALGRALSRTGLRCEGVTCQGGDGAVTIDWCAGKNEIAPRAQAGPAREPATRRPASDTKADSRSRSERPGAKLNRSNGAGRAAAGGSGARDP